MKPATIDPVLPTTDDVAFFRQHGWWISPPLIPADDLAAVCSEQDAYYEGKRERTIDLPHRGWERGHGSPQAVRKNDHASLTNPVFFDHLVAQPAVAAIAAALLGVDGIRLWHDQLLYKPPAAGVPGDDQVAVGWHTDAGYWKSCRGPMITAWVPFTDMPEELGPVAMLDGSHRWPTGQINDGDFFTNDLAGQLASFDSGGAPVEVVPMVMTAGQVSFHDWRTIHGSQPNRADRPRRSMAIHLQASTNRWQQVISQRTGRVVEHSNDHLVRRDAAGNPDYTDPDICPLLFGA